MKKIVIIPARGGSKRLPGKNIKKLGRIPLIAHSIEYAKKKHLIDKIIVSTDSSEIKEISLEWGAEVIDRPEAIAGDLTPTIDVLKYTISQISEVQDEDIIITLQPTNPLRPDTLLENCLSVFKRKNIDSLFTVSRNHHKLGRVINEQFTPFNYCFGQRSQDLEPLYYENGLLYMTKKHLINEGFIMNENSFPFILEHPYGNIDIDTLEDFNYAEFIFNSYESKKA